MQAVINIKTDLSLKLEAKQLAQDMGLTLSSVINNSLKDFVRAKAISFDNNYEPTERLKKSIRQAEQDFAKNKNISKFEIKNINKSGKVTDLKKHLMSL